MTKLAIFYQETGEDGVIEFNPDETLEQLLDRAPEEWKYRYTETPRNYSDFDEEDWDGSRQTEHELYERGWR